MKITVVGSGYAGICTGVGFALKGHDVVCIDIDEEKVKKLNAAQAPIYEEGLEDALKTAVKSGRFSASSDITKANESEVIFITVGTPQNSDGSINTGYMNDAAESISSVIDGRYRVVAVKSTVLPGTTENIVAPIFKGKNVGICANPEFLREGKALEDFLNPDRIVIGEDSRKTAFSV